MFILNIFSDLHEIAGRKTGFFPVRFIKALFAPSFHITAVYRFGNFCRKLLLPLNWIGLLIYLPFLIIIKLLYSTSLPISCQIGKRFVILNHKAVCIENGVVIGNNVSISTQVVIGIAELDDKKLPVIGNHVFLGAGAKILGDVKVNNHCVVGANSVVTADIQEYSMVSGIPAKVIRQFKKTNSNEPQNKPQQQNQKSANFKKRPANHNANHNNNNKKANETPSKKENSPLAKNVENSENVEKTNKPKKKKHNYNVGKIHNDSRKIINAN